MINRYDHKISVADQKHLVRIGPGSCIFLFASEKKVRKLNHPVFLPLVLLSDGDVVHAQHAEEVTEAVHAHRRIEHRAVIGAPQLPDRDEIGS